MNNVAVIFPSKMLHSDALKETRRLGLIPQTNYVLTVAATEKLPGFTVMGAREKSNDAPRAV